MDLIINLQHFYKQHKDSDITNVFRKAVRDIILPNYLGCNYDVKTKRAVVYYKNYDKIVFKSCNGLVFDYENLKPLNSPFKYWNITSNKDILSYKDSQIMPFIDGTYLSLYYFIDKWVISSNRSFQLNDLEWMGIKYSQALEEALASEKLSLEILDKSKSYNFVLQHPKMHPYQEVPRVYFLNASSEIPSEKTLQFRDFDEKEVENDIYSDGIIFSRDECLYLYETPKYKNIKNLVYNFAFNDFAKKNNINNHELFIINCYLSGYDLPKKYLQLKPVMDKIIDDVYTKVVNKNDELPLAKTIINFLGNLVKPENISKTEFLINVVNPNYMVIWYNHIFANEEFIKIWKSLD